MYGSIGVASIAKHIVNSYLKKVLGYTVFTIYLTVDAFQLLCIINISLYCWCVLQAAKHLKEDCLSC